MCIRDRGEVVVAVVETEGTRPLDRELINSLEAHCRRQIACLLYTSDAADERSSVDLGGRRIITKKK